MGRLALYELAQQVQTAIAVLLSDEVVVESSEKPLRKRLARAGSGLRGAVLLAFASLLPNVMMASCMNLSLLSLEPLPVAA